ncbi:hypothetical protein Tco_0732878 [Tanacetum coccineum]
MKRVRLRGTWKKIEESAWNTMKRVEAARGLKKKNARGDRISGEASEGLGRRRKRVRSNEAGEAARGLERRRRKRGRSNEAGRLRGVPWKKKKKARCARGLEEEESAWRSNEAGEAARGLEEEESAWRSNEAAEAARGLEEEEESAWRSNEAAEAAKPGPRGDRMKRQHGRTLLLLLLSVSDPAAEAAIFFVVKFEEFYFVIDAIAGRHARKDPRRRSTFDALKLDGELLLYSSVLQDLEFVQAGHIDRRLYIGLPDAKHKVQIFGVHSTKQLAEVVF